MEGAWGERDREKSVASSSKGSRYTKGKRVRLELEMGEEEDLRRLKGRTWEKRSKGQTEGKLRTD